jgi:hypothetical protein
MLACNEPSCSVLAGDKDLIARVPRPAATANIRRRSEL